MCCGIPSNCYEQHDIRNKDNNFFDEMAKSDVLYYVNTNTKNAQQNEIHHVNTVCCKKLLSEEDIIQQNLSHRAITLKFDQSTTGARDDDLYNDKSTLEMVPFVELLCKEDIIQQNHSHRAITLKFNHG